jgi:hypothetical protein
MLLNAGEKQIDDDLFHLACGPDLRVKKYKSCIVNGVRWHTSNRDKNNRIVESWYKVHIRVR